MSAAPVLNDSLTLKRYQPTKRLSIISLFPTLLNNCRTFLNFVIINEQIAILDCLSSSFILYSVKGIFALLFLLSQDIQTNIARYVFSCSKLKLQLKTLAYIRLRLLQSHNHHFETHCRSHKWKGCHPDTIMEKVRNLAK